MRLPVADALAQARERQEVLQNSGAPFHVAAMLGHRVAMLAAELAWMSQFVDAWEAQAPPDEALPAPPEPADIPRMKQLVLPQDPDSPHRRATRRARRTPPASPTEVSGETPTPPDEAR